jgi:hypothetical protein
MNVASEDLLGTVTEAHYVNERRELSLLDAAHAQIATVVPTGATASIPRRRWYRTVLYLLDGDVHEVRDADRQCLRRIVGPDEKPPVITVTDALGREVVALRSATAPWTGKSAPCLFSGGSLVGALPVQRWSMNFHLGGNIFRHDGRAVAQVRRTQKQKGCTGWGSPWYEIESCNGDAPLEEPFASAAIVAALIKAQEPHGM